MHENRYISSFILIVMKSTMEESTWIAFLYHQPQRNLLRGDKQIGREKMIKRNHSIYRKATSHLISHQIPCLEEVLLTPASMKKG